MHPNGGVGAKPHCYNCHLGPLIQYLYKVIRLPQGWHRYVLEESSTSRGGVGARLFLCCSRNDDKCQTGPAANIANIIFIVVCFFCHRDFASLENSSFLTSDARSSRKAWNWREDDFFLDEKGFSKKRFLNCEPPGRGKETGSAGSWRVPSPTFGGELKQWGWGQEAQIWRRSSFPSHNLNLWWSPTRASTEIIGNQQKGGDCF